MGTGRCEQTERALRARERRGSFLVVVVGTLALLAVVTIVYVALGNQDARTKAATVRREKLDDVPVKFAEYLQRIIAADVFDVTWNGQLDANNRPILRREAEDIPGTRWNVRSINTGLGSPFARGALGFTPTGGIARDAFTATVPNNTNIASVTPSDPWLASIKPVWLNWDLEDPADEERTYLEERDWAAISNVAPDGRAVNLWNLRNNWDAPSSTETVNGKPGISRNLTLLGDNGNGDVVTDFNGGLSIVPAFPAYFFNRQRMAFRPARVELSASPGHEAENPTNQRFKLYQWADADGDGMLDARWQEVIDARDPASPRSVVDLDSSRYRWFFATRIIDLSGLVNLNFATDLVAQPNAAYPIGLTPADIDLKRLLTLADGLSDYPTAVWGPPASDLAYGNTQYSAEQAFDAGDGGYQALRIALASGRVVPATRPDDRSVLYASTIGTTGGIFGSLAADFANGGLSQNAWLFAPWDGGRFTPLPAFSYARRRAEYFIAQANRTDQSAFESTYSFTGAFGMEDMTELLTRHGINDPLVTSNLERTIDGRSLAGNSNLRFNPGPLRSDRPLLDPADPTIGFEYPVSPSRNLAERWQYGNGTISAGSYTDRTLRQRAMDPRGLITTVSGSRPLRSVMNPNPDALTRADLKQDLLKLVESRDVRGLYRAYADALAENSDITAAWGNNMLSPPAAFNQYRTLFFGQAGPEAALLTAAHMAVNIDALANPAGPITPYTLKLADNFPALTTDASLPRAQQRFPAAHPADTNPPPPPAQRPVTLLAFDDTNTQNPSIDDLRLAPNASVTMAPAVNIYPVKPQPFLVRMSTMTVYADQPDAAPFDDRPGQEISIKGLPNNSNEDLLYRAVAFELHNPFEEDITLGDPALFEELSGYTSTAPTPIDPVAVRNIDLDFIPRNNFLTRMRDFWYIDVPGQGTDFRRYLLVGLKEQTLPAAPGQFWYNDTNPANIRRAITTLEPIVIPSRKSVVCIALSKPASMLRRELLTRGIPESTLSRPILGTTHEQQMKRLLARRFGMDNDQVERIYWISTLSDDLARGQPGSAESTHTLQFPLLVHNSRTPHPEPTGTPPAQAWRGANLLPVDRSGPASNRHVLLKRAVRAPGQAESDANGPNGLNFSPSAINRQIDGGTVRPTTSVRLLPRNVFANDVVVDRLRTKDVLNLRLSGDGEVVVPGSAIFLADPANAGEDYSFTLTMSTTVHRPIHEHGNDYKGLPAYCIEPKYNPDWNEYKGSLAPNSDSRLTGSGGLVTIPNETVFDNAQPQDGIAKQLTDWLGFMADVSGGMSEGNALYNHMMGELTGSGAISAADSKAIDDPNHRNFTGQLAASPPLDTLTWGDQSTRGLSPQFNFEQAGQNFTDVLRLTDALAPLGIGPMEVPLDNTGNEYDPQDYDNANARWTTLGEAIAIAAGYEDPNNTAFALDPSGVPALLDAALLTDPNVLVRALDPVREPLAAARDYLRFDNGNLTLDSDAPFIDTNTDGWFDGSPGVDERDGLSIPFAAQVLEQFFVAHKQIADARRPSLTNPAPGLINLNTAPLRVLRTLPMMAPVDSRLLNTSANNTPNNTFRDRGWWQDANIGTNTGSNAIGLNADTLDTAATVAAYRDMLPIYRRSATNALLTVAPFNQPPVIDGFYNADPAGLGIGNPPPPRSNALIGGLSGSVGFRGVGELLAVRLPVFNTAAGVFEVDHRSMTFLGGDQRQSSQRRFEPQGKAQSTVDSPDDGVVDEFDEKLSQVAAVANLTTTRSDIFACWFIVHGYTKEDVEFSEEPSTPPPAGTPRRPITPSVARRFLMIVDRSNVVLRGDKPRVLALREVPYDLPW